jgi:hypothetical protein
MPLLALGGIRFGAVTGTIVPPTSTVLFIGVAGNPFCLGGFCFGGSPGVV